MQQGMYPQQSNTTTIKTQLSRVTYCASQGNIITYEWIASLNIGSFINTSRASQYTDYTSQIIRLTPGTSIPLTLIIGYGGSAYSEYVKIWIDYNKDGDFLDNGELVYTTGGKVQNFATGSITVPSMAIGTTKMRVSLKYNDEQQLCEAFTYGEVEDYTVDFSKAFFKATNVKALNIQEKNKELKEQTILYPNPAIKGVFKVKINTNTPEKGHIFIYD
ncbi:MAG: GEVED domain-containing protein, partial [Polaribacter sp.]